MVRVVLEVVRADLEADRVVPAAAQVELEAVRADLEADQGGLEAGQGDLEAVPADLEAVLADLEADQGDLAPVRAGLEADPVALEAVLADLEADRVALEAVRAELEADRVELEAVRADLEADRAALEAVRADLEADLAAVVADLVGLAVASPAVGPALAVVVARLAPRALLVERLTLHRPGTAPQVEPPRVPRAQVAAQRAVASLNPEDHEAPAAVQAGRILGSRSPSPRKRTEPRRRSEWAQAATVFCWDWASHLSGQSQLGSPSWRR